MRLWHEVTEKPSQMAEDFGSPEELVSETHLGERQVRAALAYREQYPEEVAERIEENRRPPAEWHDLYPFAQISR